MKSCRLLVLAAAVTAALCANAQVTSPKLTRSRAERLVHRPVLDPVPSLDGEKPRTAVDTVDTGNPALKIILYSDQSWRYWTDGSVAGQDAIFKNNWDNVNSNPYRVEFGQLPLKAAIWLVDSAGRYHYPSDAPADVSSRYGRRRSRYHRGIDLRSPIGTDIFAVFDGKVRISHYVRGYGNLVVLRHANGLETFYGHLSRSLVKEGDWVEAGQVIARSGNTGRSSGPHLHFEVRYQGYAIDPEWMIDFPKRDLRHQVMVIKKKYLDPAAKYAPESDDEEEEIAAEDEADRLEAERIEAEMKAAQYHTVRSGDTLGALARRYGTSVSAICRLNGIKSTSTLRIGQKLRVK